MNRHRRGPWLLCLVVAATVFGPASSSRAASGTVIAQGVSFTPNEIHISLGDTVVWKYRSSPSAPNHTVTFDNGPDLNPFCPLLGSDCLSQANPSVQRTFSTAGTFRYHCKIHSGQGMTGTIVVSAPTTTTNPVTTAPKSSTTATAKASSTTTTARPTSSSTTSTTRPLATSSTVVRSSTTTSDTSSALLPGAPPSLSGDSSSAAGGSGDSGSSDRGAVALIVGLLLAVSAGGGYLLWRLRPGRP